jgi:flavin-binding protein dodecin
VGVIIIREMVGTSPRSWSDAARQAVATASRTVRNIQTVEVVKSTAVVADGEIVEYRVEVKIGSVERPWSWRPSAVARWRLIAG